MGDIPNGMLDELLEDDSEKMTAREVEFIESLNKQRGNNHESWEPSPKQGDWLADIWNRVNA